MSAQLFDKMPDLNLSVPDNWASIDCVELNEALLYEWQRNLPDNDIAAYVSEYRASLNRFHLNQIDPQQRMVLLDIYRQPLNKLIHGLDIDTFIKRITDDEQRDNTVQMMTELFRSLAMGYKIIVLEILKVKSDLRYNQLALMAINRTAEQLSHTA